MVRGEYDDYKMPELFEGELTQAQLDEREKLVVREWLWWKNSEKNTM